MPVSKSLSLLRHIMAWCMLGAISYAPIAHSHTMTSSTTRELGSSAAIDAQGHVWIVSKESIGAEQYVVLQMSPDMGKTWTAPKRIQRQPEPVAADGENRPKLAFGSKGDIYISYTKPLAKPYTGDIRFIRSTDGGKTFAPPITVHANRDIITHRFDAMIVDKTGRIYIAWIDKRDLAAATARKQTYTGAALYYAVSEDGGVSFKGDYKIADHSCECCRIALTLNAAGKPVAFWRHVFEPNARDHALLELTPDGKLPALTRATFGDWRVDACPHHGPALAYSTDGTRHQTWFNVKGDEGGVFYAAATSSGTLTTPMQLGSAQAEHADVAVQGNNIALVWKQFDGKLNKIFSKFSTDSGRTWQEKELAHTGNTSDQPHLLTTATGIVLVWRTQNEGIRIITVISKEQT